MPSTIRGNRATHCGRDGWTERGCMLLLFRWLAAADPSSEAGQYRRARFLREWAFLWPAHASAEMLYDVAVHA